MKYIKTSLFLSLFFISLQAFSQARDTGIIVDPAIVEFNLTNGQSGTNTIVITNRLPKKKQFRIFLGDWLRDTTGSHVYMEPGKLPNSCSSWISFDKSFVEIEPGERAEITVKLKVPDSPEAVKSMRWAMLFIETTQEKKASQNAGKVVTVVTTQFRIGVHVYQTPPSLSNGEIKMLSFDALPDKADSVYRIVCKNVGDVQTMCKSYIELSNLENGEKTTLDYPNFPLFPGQTRHIDFSLPKKLPKGKYGALAIVDAGSDLPLEAAQATIEVK